MQKIVSIFIMAIICLGCSDKSTLPAIPMEGDVISASDYSLDDNWMRLPSQTNKSTDVFYLYPTAWGAGEDKLPVSSIDNKEMRIGAKYSYEAAGNVFEHIGNLYIPYYRQLDAEFILSKKPDEYLKYIRGIPKADVTAAFDYFIKNYNQGRPFIIAGYSQGAMLIKELLFDYMKSHPEVYERMVAAYVIGFSVTKKELKQNPHLKFAEGADDTGVIISYNTEAPKIDGKNYTVLDGSIAINPINWSRDEKPASASENLGSYIQTVFGYDKLMNIADAKVNLKRGTVICSTVEAEKYSSTGGPFRDYFPLGVYHTYDISFYYYNLIQNAENRIQNFLKK